MRLWGWAIAYGAPVAISAGAALVGFVSPGWAVAAGVTGVALVTVVAVLRPSKSTSGDSWADRAIKGGWYKLDESLSPSKESDVVSLDDRRESKVEGPSHPGGDDPPPAA